MELGSYSLPIERRMLFLLYGYIRLIFQKEYNDTKLSIPKDIKLLCYSYLFIEGKDGVLILKENEKKELKSNYNYEFSIVILNEDSILTVNGWDPNKKDGGTLSIKSWTDFIIDRNASIQLTGKGYLGGQEIFTGESYRAPQSQQGEANFGGGGGGGYGGASGGGGYGTKGESGRKYDFNGGGIYGDKYLSLLHLGSGGGGHSYRKCGGNGGGALKIECNKFINYGNILVNGDHGIEDYDGCGSGGSIFIICDEFIMNKNDKKNNIINAIGGIEKGDGGNGGDGRIRIKSSMNSSTIDQYVVSSQIKPAPFVG